MDINKGLIAIGAGLAVMTGMMTGRGEGEVAAHACDAIGKNPEVESKICPYASTLCQLMSLYAYDNGWWFAM